MIQVTEQIAIAEAEIQEEFIRSSGPGGQNVNKVSTAVQLRFDVDRSPSLPKTSGSAAQAGRQTPDHGRRLIIEAKRFRTQDKNRQDALGRLIELIRRATEAPKPRRKTRPTLAAKTKRLEEKRQRAQVKNARATRPGADD
jgi:ribosome-associated protein